MIDKDLLAQLNPLGRPLGGMTFEEATAPVWAGTASCRDKHRQDPLVVWVRLDARESLFGDLFGVRIYQKGWLRKKEFAQLLVATNGKGYIIRAWKKRAQLVDIFTTDETLTSDVAAQVAVETFEKIVDWLAEGARRGALAETFPAAWVGDSAWKPLREMFLPHE